MSSIQASQTPNYYEILGADPLATLEDIEGLFRQLAAEADAAGDHSNVPQAIEAFRVLRDSGLRQQYDQQLSGSSAEPTTGGVDGAEITSPLTDAAAVGDHAQVETWDDEMPTSTMSFEEELELSPAVLSDHRRELLKMFYEKKRKDMRKSGIAIGGLDSIVPYSYELLEFHLWVLAEKRWIIREESGALSISASGCESHEQNLMDGLVQPG
jgi:curved DNA-binding protein CbpA